MSKGNRSNTEGEEPKATEHAPSRARTVLAKLGAERVLGSMPSNVVDLDIEVDLDSAFEPLPASVSEATRRPPQPPSKRPPGPPARKKAAKKPAPAPAHPVPLRRGLSAERLLARGGFAAVHVAYDKDLLRHVAVKSLHERGASVSGARTRFVEEGQITAQLNHPNIVPVYEVVTDEHDELHYVMKLVEGRTLTEVLESSMESKGQEDYRELLRIFLRICDAIAFAHERGVIHRDLKPDNIMVGSHGQVYVMDWGLAQVLGSSQDGEGSGRRVRVDTGVHRADLIREPDPDGVLVGTISYMSPEQARGLNSQLDTRSDIFALGALLYAILTRRPPYSQRVLSQRILAAQRAEIPPPQEVVEGGHLPPGLCRIAMKAMALHPRDRYPDVASLKEDIERFLSGGFWFGTKSYQPGELIIRQGDLPDAAHVITSGVAEVFKTSEDGRRHVLRRMGPGDVFGETAILTDSRRSASVVAHTAVTTMIVTPDSLKEELAADSWMGAFVKALADRFRERDERLTQAAYAVEDARIIATIMKHMTFHGETVEEGVVRALWTPLCEILAQSFEVPEKVLLRVVERFGDHVRFDRERRYLWLRK